jgi:alkylation response protein AidB-like acyl-CoA dehydrogenase
MTWSLWESFRERALAWAAHHLERADPEQPRFLLLEEAKQRQASVLYAGFAGIAIPTRFGGAGLTLAHQQVWAETVAGHLVPAALQVSLGRCSQPVALALGGQALRQADRLSRPRSR